MKRFLIAVVLLAATYSQAQLGTATNIRHGATLPTACADGDIFYKSASVIGTYECSVPGNPGTWRLIYKADLADPGSNGIVKRTALNTTAAASASDVAGLFSGCSGVQYLGADGACHSPTAAGLADPGSNGIVKRTALNTTTAATSTDIMGLWTGSCDGTTALLGDGSCGAVSGSANVHLTFSATAGTAITFTHGLASSSVVFNCADSSDNVILPTYAVFTSSNVVTAAFAVGAGYCNFNATGSAAGIAGLSGTLIVPITLPAAVCQGTVATSGFSLPASNAPTPACVTGSNTNIGVLQFPAGSTTSGQLHIALPPDVDCSQALDLAIKWRAASTSNSVTWGAQTVFVADGSTVDPSFNTASTVAHAPQGTTLQLRTDTITNITKTGCAASSEMFIKVYRDGSDTMSGNAEMVGATLKYRRAL